MEESEEEHSASSGSENDLESYDSLDSDNEISTKNMVISSHIFNNPMVSNMEDADDSNNSDKGSVGSSDSDKESSSEEDEEQESKSTAVDKSGGNAAWADAMAKILKMNKPKRRKVLVLSRAKKLQDVKPVMPAPDFEIVPGTGDDGSSKQEVMDEDELDDKKPVMKKVAMMKEMYTRGRVKPTVLEKDRERMLSKIATKGVVQLFNAVRQQQRVMEAELRKAGRSGRKKEKVLNSLDKSHVLDNIAKSAKSIPLDNDLQVVPNRGPSWGVLRDDFMMGSKLKDWDRQENAEEAKPE